jgi:hypothetical protein
MVVVDQEQGVQHEETKPRGEWWRVKGSDCRLYVLPWRRTSPSSGRESPLNFRAISTAPPTGGRLALGLALLTVFAAEAQAQRFTEVPAEPGQLAREGFDTERAIFWVEPNFTPLRDPEWQTLQRVRSARDVSDETPILVFEAGGRTLSLVSSQMAYHHVAQGEMAGEPWMVTF